MITNNSSIFETPDAFIVNGIAVPKMKRGQMNTYDPAIIKAVGPDLFFQLVGPKEAVPMPDLGFTDAEWDNMEKNSALINDLLYKSGYPVCQNADPVAHSRCYPGCRRW